MSTPSGYYTAINPALTVKNGYSSLDPGPLFDTSKTWYGKVTTIIHCHLNPNVADDHERYSPPMFSVGDIKTLIAIHSVSTLSPKLK